MKRLQYVVWFVVLLRHIFKVALTTAIICIVGWVLLMFLSIDSLFGSD